MPHGPDIHSTIQLFSRRSNSLRSWRYHGQTHSDRQIRIEPHLTAPGNQVLILRFSYHLHWPPTSRVHWHAVGLEPEPPTKPIESERNEVNASLDPASANLQGTAPRLIPDSKKITSWFEPKNTTFPLPTAANQTNFQTKCAIRFFPEDDGTLARTTKKKTRASGSSR